MHRHLLEQLLLSLVVAVRILVEVLLHQVGVLFYFLDEWMGCTKVSMTSSYRFNLLIFFFVADFLGFFFVEYMGTEESVYTGVARQEQRGVDENISKSRSYSGGVNSGSSV